MRMRRRSRPGDGLTAAIDADGVVDGEAEGDPDGDAGGGATCVQAATASSGGDEQAAAGEMGFVAREWAHDVLRGLGKSRS